MLFSKLVGRMAEKGLTQGDVAKALGITSTTLRKKLKGLCDWKLTEIYKLIDLLSISYEEVFDYFFAPLNFR